MFKVGDKLVHKNDDRRRMTVLEVGGNYYEVIVEGPERPRIGSNGKDYIHEFFKLLSPKVQAKAHPLTSIFKN